MAPLDMDQLMKIDPDGIDDDEVDDLYNALTEFDVGDHDDSAHLKKLFEVTKSIMERKNLQAEVAEQELEEIMSTEGRSTAKKDQEMEDLRRELETMKRENRELQRFGGDSGKLGGKDESRYLRDEVIELESQVDRKEKEIHDLEAQLREEKQTSDQYIERTDKAEKENRDLRRDNEQLRDDIRDFQRQVESQRESMLSKRDEDFDVRDKMTQKNKLLAAALEENRNLAENNVELEIKIEDMKKQMKDGQEEIERTTDEYLKLKMVVDKSDSVIDGLRRDNEMLKDQIADLMEQVKSKADMDDEIMVKVNDKVEEWKGILADKDMRIHDQQEQILAMRDQLIAANMDSEKTSIAALSKALEDRDKQISSLKHRLEDVVEEMDADVAMMDDIRSEMHKSGKGDRHLMKISQLQGTLKYHESQMKDAESRTIEAERDARSKDKDLNEALERIRALESGEYGLPEAVSEIKELKQHINTRDRQIEELTQYINKCEEKVNDLYDETEDLRERLGLDPKEPLDLTEYKKKKGIRMQEDRALNRVLQKEIEQLEEERIQMKSQIRKLAQAGGTRAVALGLEADDMGKLEEYIEDLKQKKKQAKASKIMKKEVEDEVFKARAMQLGAEVGQKDQKLDVVTRENVELTAKTKELEKENKNLEKGMKEIHQAIKEQSDAGGQVQTIECPTLERMLAVIETRNLTGGYDAGLYLKAQVDNLTGHNEELRKELREVRYESTRAQVEREKAYSKLEVMESELTSMKEAGAGGFYQTVHLPEGMAVASSDVIASLNERLVQVLQEVTLKEEMLMKTEDSLDTFRRKFALMRHQQGLLYQDHLKEKKQWETDREFLENQVKKLQGQVEDDQVQVQEFDRLLNTLQQEEPEVRRRLAETTRKITVLRVNEKALARRFNGVQEIEGYLRKENTRLRNDMIAMEAAVSDRLGYLQRHKEMTTFKMASLQRMLDDSVPEIELETVNRKFTDLTEKYRDLLEKSNNLVASTEAESGFEIEVKRLSDQNNYLQQELSIEKEKLHTLEAAFEKMKRAGITSSQSLSDSELTSISKKLTTLEMKELNERQRAEHASRMYDSQKKQLRDLEDRNFELEQKFAELTRMNIDQQKVERQIRDELAKSVTKAVSDADRQRIANLEKSETNLRIEVSKLKDIAEVASSQVRALENQNTSRDKEVTSLRQQLLDFQAQSDEKTIIGKLHRHIVQLQISEGMALRKLEDIIKKLSKSEAHLLRTEQRIDDKDQTIYHNRMESRNKTKYLKHTIQDLRNKYAGAVPLHDQEKFADKMIKITEEKKKIEEDYRQTNEERRRVEDKLQEVELQHKGLQNLIVTLKDGKGAQKVAEWHSKMEQIRLEDLRLKREIDRHKERLKFQENMLKKHESEMISLEEDKVRLAREFETRELEWEHREVELERIIGNMERQQAEIAGAATQFEDAVGALPDPSLPVSEQLEVAVSTIKRNVKLVLDAKAESAYGRKKIEELEQDVKEKNREVLARDRIINELRLRLPASAERDQAIAKATALSTKSAAGADDDFDYESKQAVRVAQTTVHHLQARIHQKEETIQKYQELLRQARDDMSASNKRHEEEMRLMQDKLNNKTDAAFHKFKQAVQDSLAVQGGSKIPTNDQLRRLNELEDIVADQDNSISALREKLTKARQEIQDWRYKYEDNIKLNAQEKDGLLGNHSEEVQQISNHMDNMKRQLKDKEREYDILLEELEVQKEANSRAPTASMKKLVERLRNELALKEKQHQALSKALMQLRGEMVSQAQDEVRANADQNALELNVQKLVDKESKELKVRIQELDTAVTKLRKEKKKLRDTETTLNTELDETKQELAMKEGQLRKAKDDRHRLEKDVDELERKVERMNTMGKQAAGTTGIASSENMKQEIDELRRKNKLLQDEVKRSKHQAEKPYEQQGKDGDLQVAKWEENKKWQKLTDRLKTRVKDKDAELEKLHKSNEMLKNALDRANKDKEMLESKLRSVSKPPIERQIVAREASTSLGAAPPTVTPQQMHGLETIRKKNYELEEENAGLRRQLTHGRDAAFKEVQLRNKFLTDRLEQMEQHMQHRAVSSSQEGTVGHNTYRELAKKESSLQRELIKMSEENIELKFESEQAKKDVPRLKGRIEDLEKYIEILKEEKRQMEIMRTSSRSLDSLGSLGSNLSGNYKRIGESGKTTKELEKTIALLKKVIEKSQSENEQLRKAPGLVSNEQFKTLQTENQTLKSQLEELRSKMGATLSDRYVTTQKGTAKIMADHDKLRRDLIKGQEESEKLRVQVKEKDLTIDKLQRSLRETKGRLEVMEAKHPSLSSMDSKQWSSVVLPKMSEEKIKTLEKEVDRKNQMLSEVKVLLREAAENEHNLLQAKKDLEEKVEILERFPPGAKSGQSDVVKQYQLSRLTIDRLENEKKELVNELRLLKKHPEMESEDLVKGIVSHNKLMKENVDIRTQMKTSQMEKDRLRHECDRLRKELDNFGPDFFENIEDLKYNYHEAVQKNVQYEEQLTKLSRQFGVRLDLPGGL